jgi:hypothetical protein
MAIPTLTPARTPSAIVLPVTGTHANVNSVNNTLPFGIYNSTNFISGAVDQVSYVYKKLGGDVLDIEITEYQVYAAYEEAVLEYSYIVNIHQSKNILSDILGATTGTFDQDGEIITGPSDVALKYPRFTFGYAKKVSEGVGTEINIGGTQNLYSASFDLLPDQQDYDLQSIVSSSANDNTQLFFGLVGNKKITVKKVFYKSPYVMWRFFGYYGGLSVVGNLHNYGQWSDDSTFELIPTWQNKMQAMAFDDSVYTRISHYSYELKNNKLRVYPSPSTHSPASMWIEFNVAADPWDEDSDRVSGVEGVNNMNTAPLANIPYENINSIGKQWIRRFALAVCKEMLGHVRGKFSTVPIPGESVTLNHSELLSQSKEEQEKLREELKTVLDELVYAKLAEADAAKMESATKAQQNIPVTIFVG